MRWRLVLAGGFLAEMLVFAIVFPTLYLFGQQKRRSSHARGGTVNSASQ